VRATILRAPPRPAAVFRAVAFRAVALRAVVLRAADFRAVRRAVDVRADFRPVDFRAALRAPAFLVVFRALRAPPRALLRADDLDRLRPAAFDERAPVFRLAIAIVLSERELSLPQPRL
jgi:hypothetical protein